MTTIRSQKTGTYNVTLSSYCGMSSTLAEDVPLDEAKEVAKRVRRRARKQGCPVEKIGTGQWEIGTPEDACMVGDGEGILSVRPRMRRYRVICGRKHYID